MDVRDHATAPALVAVKPPADTNANDTLRVAARHGACLKITRPTASGIDVRLRLLSSTPFLVILQRQNK